MSIRSRPKPARERQGSSAPTPRLDPASLLHTWVVVTVVVGSSFPLAWMLYSSLKTNREIFARSFGLPTTLHFEHFVEAWTEGHMGRLYLNSLFVTAVSVLITVALASLAAYAFARLTFPGRDLLYYTFLVGLLLPSQTVAAVLLRDLRLLNSYWALILPYSSWALAVTVYLLNSFYETLPRSYEDAAKMDGASLFQTYCLVMIPLIRPALIMMVILNAVNL